MAYDLSPLSGHAHLTEVRAFRFNATKRRLIRTIFAGTSVRFVWWMGLRWRNYPESLKRAEAALATARRRPRAAWLFRLRISILRLQYNATRCYFERSPGTGAVAWNGLVSSRNIFMMAARDAGRPTLFLERGPLPQTITADPQGVNFANGLPQTAAPYRQWAAANPDRLGSWRNIAARLVGRSPAKAAAASEEIAAPPLSGPFVFVPLQKQGDTQLRIFGGLCRDVDTTLDLIVAAASSLPEGWHIRIKEHPTDRPRVGQRAGELGKVRIFIDNRTETFTQVRAARVVLTVNSSVGLEAMMLEKPVIAMGQAFWALPGLAESAGSPDALARCFDHIERIGFDGALRDAFLSFLVAEYYLPVITGPDGRPSIDPSVRCRLLARMASGRVL